MKNNFFIRIDANILSDIRLNNSDKIVYGIIYAFSLNKKGFCLLTYRQIAEKANMKKRNFYLCVKKLEQAGYIKRIISKNRTYLQPLDNTKDIEKMENRKRKKYDRGFEYDVFNEEE